MGDIKLPTFSDEELKKVKDKSLDKIEMSLQGMYHYGYLMGQEELEQDNQRLREAIIEFADGVGSHNGKIIDCLTCREELVKLVALAKQKAPQQEGRVILYLPITA